MRQALAYLTRKQLHAKGAGLLHAKGEGMTRDRIEHLRRLYLPLSQRFKQPDGPKVVLELLDEVERLSDALSKARQPLLKIVRA
jgi:hypothetical protein